MKVSKHATPWDMRIQKRNIEHGPSGGNILDEKSTREFSGKVSVWRGILRRFETCKTAGSLQQVQKLLRCSACSHRS